MLIGAGEWGRKEIIGLTDGYRESAQSWRELWLALQRCGLAHAPDLAIGDGALGFWDALPKSVQAKAKAHLHDIWQAETRSDAELAFDFFATTYGVKYDKAVAKLTKDRDVLLSFYDCPAERAQVLANTSAQPTQSKAPLPPSGTAQAKPRGASAAKPASLWRSS